MTITKLKTAMFAPVSPLLVVLATIATTDMLYTTYGISNKLFEEYNPLMQYVINRYGLSGFIFVKSMSIIIPISILGIVPSFVKDGQKLCNKYIILGIIAYISLMIIGILFQLF